MHAAQHTDACSASKGQFNVKYTGYAQGDGAEAFMRHANAARGILKFLGRAKHFAHLDQLGLSHNRSALRATVTTLSRKIRHATRVMKMCTKELLVVMEKYNVTAEVIGEWHTDFVTEAKSANGVSAAGLNPWEEFAYLESRAAKFQEFVTDPSNGEVEVEAMDPLRFNNFKAKKYSTLTRNAMRAVNEAQKAKNALRKAHDELHKGDSTPRPRWRPRPCRLDRVSVSHSPAHVSNPGLLCSCGGA